MHRLNSMSLNFFLWVKQCTQPEDTIIDHKWFSCERWPNHQTKNQMKMFLQNKNPSKIAHFFDFCLLWRNKLCDNDRKPLKDGHITYLGHGSDNETELLVSRDIPSWFSIKCLAFSCSITILRLVTFKCHPHMNLQNKN